MHPKARPYTKIENLTKGKNQKEQINEDSTNHKFIGRKKF